MIDIKPTNYAVCYNVPEFSWMLNVHFQRSSRCRFVYSCHANWDSATSGLGARRIYFRYNATSGDIVDNTIEQVDLENMGVAVEILFLGALKLAITLGVFYHHPISIMCM